MYLGCSDRATQSAGAQSHSVGLYTTAQESNQTCSLCESRAMVQHCLALVHDRPDRCEARLEVFDTCHRRSSACKLLRTS